MKSFKNIAFVVFLLSAISGYAQPNYTDKFSQGACSNLQGTDLTTPKFQSLFIYDQDGSEYYVRQRWKANNGVNVIFPDWTPSQLLITGSVCAPWSASPVILTLRVNKTVTIGDASYDINDFKITDITSNTVVYYLPKTPGTNYQICSNSSSPFYPTAGHIYKCEADITYMYKFITTDGHHTEHVIMYYCSGPLFPGGTCSPLDLKVTRAVDCSTATIGFNSSKNVNNAFKYYFTDQSDLSQFEVGEFNEVGNSKAKITKAGDYRIIAYHTLSRSRSPLCNTVHVDFPGRPAAPTFTGPFSFCPCTQSTITLSANYSQGSGVEWWNLYPGAASVLRVSSAIATTATATSTYTVAGLDNFLYIRTKNADGCYSDFVKVEFAEQLCGPCKHPFAPEAGKYVLTAWVKQSGAEVANYEKPYVEVKISGTTPFDQQFKASGQIIDGWQRLEATFDIGAGATLIEVTIGNSSSSGDVFFDDIRIQPFNSSLVTYVYDPHYMRLVAQLDEDNYGTFYIYDDEGHLVKMNQETVDGKLTVSETRTNVSRK